MIALGTLIDGRGLAYDATLYEFRVERSVVSFADVAALDRAGHIAWLAGEQRDWFWRIDPTALDRCNREALGRHGNGYEGLSPEEQVLADAKRNDSVLAGKIVDADPVLVQAVAAALEEQGLLGGSAPAHPAVAMPQGMEALGQVQKQEGRKMTVLEHYLMRQILKNDDKAKVKREKKDAQLEEAVVKEEEAAKAELEENAEVHKGQARMAKKEKATERDLRKRSEGKPVRTDVPGMEKQGAFKGKFSFLRRA